MQFISFFRQCVFALLLCCVLAVVIAANAYAGAEAAVPGKSSADSKYRLTDTAMASLTSLIEMTANKGMPLDVALAGELVDYMVAAPDEDKLPPMESAQGIAHRTKLNVPLSRVLEYAYNPKVPAYLVLPSVVRLAGWYQGSEIYDLDRPLYKMVEDYTEPVVVRGREFEEITPDAFSGSYYRYDLDRVLVMFKHKGRNAFISVSRQVDESSVGKKGVVLDDSTWDYFYSGIDGLTTGGIGWMDTYMYGSWSVGVYLENEDGSAVNSMMFKWLRAGWAGLNVVRSKHIREGTVRYANAFKSVLESDQLPESSELAAKAAEVNSLPEAVLAVKVREYAVKLENKWKDHPVLSRSSFAELVENGGYVDVLSREQQESLLMLEYLKTRLQPGA